MDSEFNMQRLREAILSTRKYRSAQESIEGEAEGYLEISGIDVKGTTKLIYAGMEYPENGVVPSDVLSHVNVVKRLVIEGLRSVTNPLLWPYVLGILVSKGQLNTAVKSLNDVSFRCMGHTIVKPEHMTRFGAELMVVIREIAFGFGVERSNAVTLSEILGNVIDYDNAYRYRIQDLVACTSKEAMLKRPIREVWRLAKINAKRERQHGPMVSSKFRLFALAICATLCLPRFRGAFRDAIRSSSWDAMLPDQSDRFWMCVRSGYDFFGMTDTERRISINHLRVAKPKKNKS